MAHELCDVKGIIGITLKEGKEKHFHDTPQVVQGRTPHFRLRT